MNESIALRSLNFSIGTSPYDLILEAIHVTMMLLNLVHCVPFILYLRRL